MVTVPAFKIVTVLPLIDAMVASDDTKLTGKRDVDVAVRLKGASPNVRLAKVLKVMD